MWQNGTYLWGPVIEFETTNFEKAARQLPVPWMRLSSAFSRVMEASQVLLQRFSVSYVCLTVLSPVAKWDIFV